jgi:hypothetical protein
MNLKASEKIKRVKQRLYGLSAEELNEVYSWTKERLTLLRKKEWAAKLEAAWEEMKELDLKAGDILFHHGAGVNLGPTWQSGDGGVVYMIRPRKRLIWLDTEIGWVALTPREWVIDNISPELPTSVISPYQRRFGAAMGKAINKVFTGVGR